MKKRSLLVSSLTFAAWLWTFGAAQAQDTITNATLQFPAAFDQPGLSYPFVSPCEPRIFQPMDTWFLDFAALTNAVGVVTNYPGQVQDGITVWQLRLIQAADTGEVVVEYVGTNEVELLRIAAPTGYVPFTSYDEVLRTWCILGACMNPTNYDALMAEGFTSLDPPRIVMDVWAVSAADEDAYFTNGVTAASEEGDGGLVHQSLGEGGMMLMDEDPCTATNSTFAVLSISQDTNGWTTVVVGPTCTNYIVGWFSTETLTTNTQWVSRSGGWAGDGTSTYVDASTAGTAQRFYRAILILPTATSDWDGDGMPDIWEAIHDLNPFDPADATDDPDSDGFTNLEEYKAGTDPHDASSHPVFNEWYGPFASWTNVMAFGAVGDGAADDTTAISNALAVVGTGSCSPVLYFPSNHTYRVTKKLWLRNRQYVEIVGLDRDTTIIKYDGATNGTWSGPATVFHLDGVLESHIARLTFDGNGKAKTILSHSVSSGGFFDEGNSIVDCVFKSPVNIESTNEGHGIDAGFYGNGFANIDFTRCIITNTSIGLYTWNQNALDGWLTDCYLVDNIFGVYLQGGSAHAYHSTFSNTEADFILGFQSINFISIVDNTSYRSGVFFAEFDNGGNNITPTLIKGNIIIDPLDTPIQIGQPGPVLLADNVIAYTNTPAVSFLNNTRIDLVAIGNTNVISSWDSFNVNAVVSTNLVDNYVVARSNLTFTMPPPPASATNLNRVVVEVASNATATQIQSAIDNAADGAVIHIPWTSNNHGALNVNQTITMPTNKDIRIVGDGYNTKLAWSGSGGGTMFFLPHPSHVTFAHLQLYGDSGGAAGPLVAVSGVDSTSARVYVRDTKMDRGITANIRLGDCPNTVIDYRGITSGGTSVSPANGSNAILDGRGKLKMIDVDSDNNALGFVCTNGGSLYVETSYNEAGNTFSNKIFRVSGNSSVTFLSGVQHENIGSATDFSRATTNGFAVTNFTGNLTMGLVNGVIDWCNLSGVTTGNVWIAGDTTIACPTNRWPIVNSTTNVPVQTMNWNYNGGASRYTNDIGSASASYTRQMLAQARAEYSDLAPMQRRTNQTDVLIENVFLELGSINLSVKP